MKKATPKTQSAKPSSKPAAKSERVVPITHPKPAAPKPPPKADDSTKAAPDPLPPSLTAALPAAKEIVYHATEIAKLIGKLTREMDAAKKRGAIDLARSFTVLHRLCSTVDQRTSGVGELFERYKTVDCPEVFDLAGVTHVPLAEGYRVQISHATRASIRPDFKQQAYKWLKDNGKGDVITSTVNSSTLSALARTMSEEENLALPDEFFNVALVPNTSVVKS